jgi:hypothetical protein
MREEETSSKLPLGFTVGLLTYSSCIHRRWLACERGRPTFRGSFPLRAFPAPSLYTNLGVPAFREVRIDGVLRSSARDSAR